MTVLVFNMGSSSLKIAVFDILENKLVKTHFGKVDYEKTPSYFLIHQLNSSKKKQLTQKIPFQNLKSLFDRLHQLFPKIDQIGHRIVHGGDFFNHATRITPKVKIKLKHLKNWAPLHNPIEIKCIELAEHFWKKASQIALFDTAFFKTLPLEHQYYPLPSALFQKGIKRYGFHGLSHEYAVEQVHLQLKKKNLKIITCHLGSGCSIAASKNKKCLDTTMGFTPLDGVMMGTRPGSLDPGILLYLLKNKIYSLRELEHMLYHESGLKGISGDYEDFREMLKNRHKNPKSELAFKLFTHSIAKGVAQMLTSLGGCDALIFTGGIGENSSQLRRAVLKKLSFLNFKIAQKKKFSTCLKLSSDLSKTSIWVVPSQEEEMIAKHLLLI